MLQSLVGVSRWQSVSSEHKVEFKFSTGLDFFVFCVINFMTPAVLFPREQALCKQPAYYFVFFCKESGKGGFKQSVRKHCDFLSAANIIPELIHLFAMWF